MAKPILELHGVNLRIDDVPILRNVELSVAPGEVHAVVGEHGSGKSSLGKLVVGMETPTSGQVWFKDRQLTNHNLHHARKLNIEMAFQESGLVDSLSPAENLFLMDHDGFLETFAFFHRKNTDEQAQQLLGKYGFNIDVRQPVSSLNFSQQTVIYILRCIHRQPDLLILDEVLSRLDTGDFDRVLSVLLELRERGSSILWITHNIDDIYALADRVTVMRHGEVLLTDSVAHIDRVNLIKLSYTQITQEDGSTEVGEDFYQLLKFNEAILQKLPVNLIITDSNHRIKLINEPGQQYFAVEKTLYRDLPLEALFLPDNPRPLGMIKTAISQQKDTAFYDVPLFLDGIKRIVGIRTFPIYDGLAAIGCMIIIEDVSERENLRQQVILSEKLASVGLLAAGVAHEINNPLEIIYNCISYLRFNMRNSSLGETVDDLEEEVANIRQIVSGLVSFSDNRKITVEEFDLNELINGIARLLRFSARERKVKIATESDDPTVVVRANKNEIKQVILNLIKNSFEAMPGGGDIRIRTSTEEDDDSRVAMIRIQDTGEGIQAENEDDVFLPFYSTKKGSGQNQGLGLSIIYGIVQKYGGTIRAANQPGGGCEFTVTLPTADSSVAKTLPDEIETPSPSTEDDPNDDSPSSRSGR